MSFVNTEIDLDTLPRFDDVHFRELHPHYPLVVLGIALAIEAVVLLIGAIVLFIAPIPWALRLSILAAALLAMTLLAAFAHASASVIRYAIRQHDVIVRSGVFWKKETVQPIKRIQHVEQEQGPVDKRFGLSTLKLFSAGTGHVTFRIPGLEAATASAIKRFILSYHEPDGEDALEAPPHDARLTEPAPGAPRVIDG